MEIRMERRAGQSSNLPADRPSEYGLHVSDSHSRSRCHRLRTGNGENGHGRMLLPGSADGSSLCFIVDIVLGYCHMERLDRSKQQVATGYSSSLLADHETILRLSEFDHLHSAPQELESKRDKLAQILTETGFLPFIPEGG